MSFCNKCGNDLEEGASFCGKCGTPINFGNPNVNSFKANPLPKIDSEMAGKFFSNFGTLLKNMLLKPISTIQAECKTTSIEPSVVLLAILGLLTGLFSCLIVKNSSKFFESIAGFSSLFSLICIDISYIKIFLMSMFMYVIAVGLIFVVMYIFSKLLPKTSDINIKSTFNVAVISTMPFIVGYLLFWLLGYVSYSFSVIFLLVGIIVAIISLFKGYLTLTNISENIMVYVASVCILVAVIGMAIIFNGFSSSILSATNSVNF